MFKIAPPASGQVFLNERTGGYKWLDCKSRYVSREIKCKSCFLWGSGTAIVASAS